MPIDDLDFGNDNSTPAKRGYINQDELVQIFRNSNRWAIAIAALGAAVAESGHLLLANADKIYTGPGSATVAAIAGSIALVWRLSVVSRRVLNEGDDDAAQ